MDDSAVGAGLGIGIILFMLIIGLAVYLFFGYCIKLIAEKTGHSDVAHLWWIPIANLVPLMHVAGKPVWWIVLCLIPIANIIVLILVWMEVAKARGKDVVWGIIAWLFPIIGIPYLAFSD